LVIDIVIILATTVGIYFSSELLSKSVDAIGTHYRINPSVRGATLDAVGSSFPEFCTVIVALQAGAFDAGIGTIAGSALYNILIIPAVSVFVGGALTIKKEVVRRDGFLYLAVVLILILSIWFGPRSEADGTTMHLMHMWVGLGFIAIYAGYVVFLLMQARKGAGGAEEEEHEFHAMKVAGLTVGGIVGVGICTHFLVHAGLELFEHIGLSQAVAGVTLLAAATSLPDTLLSVFAVRRGDADGAVANAFGSNSFDILVCLGLPVLVMGGVAVNWGQSWPILTFLLGATVVSVFFLITDWTLTRVEAIVMMAIYLVFMVLAFTGIL